MLDASGLTFRESLQSFWRNLYDEAQGSLVSFSSLKNDRQQGD
jgi:hypothetical protein